MITRFLYLAFLLIVIACTETPSSSSSSRTLPPSAQHETATNDLSSPSVQAKPCQLPGKVLENNQLVLLSLNKQVRICADSTTYDSQFGESHRIFEIINLQNCSVEQRLTLPVNESPDFPYLLADINYNDIHSIVPVKAAKSIYCYDAVRQQMLPGVQPVFANRRNASDASSGQIIHLEIWENYLVGYAQEYGSFVFALTENQPAAQLPFAEWQSATGAYHSLFLIPSEDGQQAILPDFDWEEEVFNINPIFSQPVLLKLDVTKSARNNRFIILRQAKNNEAVLIDMNNRQRVTLPAKLKEASVSDILEWAKSTL